MGDKNYRWYLAHAEDAEIFDGVHDTREEALSAGVAMYGADPFVLLEADKAVARPDFNADWVIDTILEQLEESNVECWGEDGVDDGWGDVAVLRSNLEKAVADWLLSDPPRTFCVDHVRTCDRINVPLAA